MDRVKKPVPPEILAFAQSIRQLFGPGVTLHKGLLWPGGASTKGKRGSEKSG